MNTKLPQQPDAARTRRRDAKSTGAIPSRRLLPYTFDRHGDVVELEETGDDARAAELEARWLARAR